MNKLKFYSASEEKLRPEGWSEWSNWTACSVSCGEGTRVKRRKCQGNSLNCPGNNVVEERCYTAKCNMPCE